MLLHGKQGSVAYLRSCTPFLISMHLILPRTTLMVFTSVIVVTAKIYSKSTLCGMVGSLKVTSYEVSGRKDNRVYCDPYLLFVLMSNKI